VLQENLKPHQIYTSDNFRLCLKGLLTRTLVFEKEKCVSRQSSKESLMVMCCANASGSHSMKLIVIGEGKLP
jgi:hypothetical protein